MKTYFGLAAILSLLSSLLFFANSVTDIQLGFAFVLAVLFFVNLGLYRLSDK